MTRFTTPAAATAALLALCLAPGPARAGADGPHLELAAAATPTFVQDPGYEAFSETDLRSERFGADLRVQALAFENLRLLPFLSYRGVGDEGSPYDVMDTRLGAHDFLAGLRLRAWFLSWLGAFVQVEGGFAYERFRAELNDGWGAHEYEDDGFTWCAGGLLGVELRLPPKLFEKQGVDWLGFGVEVGGGYLRHGEIDVDPALEGGDENALPVADTAALGSLNLSGWTVQIALTVSLF